MFDLASPDKWFQLSRLVSTITHLVSSLTHGFKHLTLIEPSLFLTSKWFQRTHLLSEHSSITPHINHLLFQPSLSIMHHTCFQPSNLISTITCGFSSHSFYHHHICSQSSHLGSTHAVSTVALAFNHNTWLWPLNLVLTIIPCFDDLTCWVRIFMLFCQFYN